MTGKKHAILSNWIFFLLVLALTGGITCLGLLSQIPEYAQKYEQQIQENRKLRDEARQALSEARKIYAEAKQIREVANAALEKADQDIRQARKILSEVTKTKSAEKE